ncbi:MAG: hypothetical protein K8S54_07840 [Spirochaetia bacterium]|nr:hypothetical protein [Spirochaetia bacterium]
MNRSRIIFPVILFLVLLFALITQSIVSVTLLELRVQIASERILNFELSSRMLKTRFRQMISGEDNLKAEIKMNVLESSVLNFDSFELEGSESLLNRFGVLVINGVRRLNFKPPIRLQEDKDFMTTLQYAFFLERNRRYDTAHAKYRQLIDDAGGSSDTMGFLKLHAGYCGALTGKTDESIVELEQVIKEYPGTHYAETAQLILDILRERKQKTDKLESSTLSDREMALALFRAGNFGGALARFKKLESLSMDEEYMLSRSNEETGNIKDAIAGYIDVVNKGGGTDPAVKSNRRLMLIGNFYNGGKEVREFSQQTAVKLKDTAVLQDVQEGKELQLKPVIVEKLLNAKDQKQSALVEEIKRDMDLAMDDKGSGGIPRPDLPDAAGRMQIDLPTRPENSITSISRPPVPGLFAGAFKLALKFRDGRIVRGTRIEFNKDAASVYSGEYEISVPTTNLDRIEAPEPGTMLVVMPLSGEPFEISGLHVQGDSFSFKRGTKEDTLAIAAVKEIRVK